MIIKFFVLIKVEVGYHAVEVFRLELSKSVFSLELANLVFVDEADVCSVDAFEGGVGFELAHGAKYLPHFFNLDLLISRVKK